MKSLYSSQSRAERLIAAGRVVLAVLTLPVISLDLSSHAKDAKTVYTLLAAYVAYALLLALLVWRSGAPVGRQRVLMHAFDLAVFSLLMYFTEGSNSPFFVYFVFLIMVASLRWQWRGALWTALAALATFIGIGVYGSEIVRDPTFDLNGFVIRCGYLAVVAILLGCLGVYEDRVRSETLMLAAWPREVPREDRKLVGGVLEDAAGILRSPRVLMVWQIAEDPWLQLALWPCEELHWSREAPATFKTLVAEPLVGTDFLCQNGNAPVATVMYTSPAGLQRWRGAPLNPKLRAWFGISAVLSLRLHGGTLKGRLFSLDKRGMTPDDLMLGEMVARLVSARMDHFYLLQSLKHVAVTEARTRLARDLHDGLLQSLTGVALQLETAWRLLEEKPQAAREALLDIQRLVAAQQRDLRFLIQELKPVPVSPSEPESSLAARLDELVRGIERHWGLRVDLNMHYLEARIPESLTQEIFRIVQEALVNAARHAHASTVQMEIGARDNQVRIIVADDGRGFHFHGRYDHASLAEMKLGPVMLRERIASVGGALSINSTKSGARLEITLPLAQPGG
jgi:signal transduction histidine kinase